MRGIISLRHRRSLRVLAVAGFMALLAQSGGAQNYVPGVSYFGRSNYIEYIAGELPTVFAAPHGGALNPAEIPDRTYGTFATDSNTEDLARKIRTEFGNRFGLLPHVIICRLDRQKIDCNRDIVEGAQGDAEAEIAWNEFHNFIGAAQTNATARHGRGLFIDVHGHGHTIQRLELGYLLSTSELNLSDATLNGSAAYQNSSSIRALSVESPLSFAALLRGSNSFGGLISDEGYPAVPSPAAPGPGSDPYFNGGYNTDRYGSDDGGSFDAFQIESNFTGVRDSSANRTAFAQALARALETYFAAHYGSNLRESTPKVWLTGSGSVGTAANWLNGFLPVSTNHLLFAGAGGTVTHNLAALTTGAGVIGSITFSNAPTGSYTWTGNTATMLRGVTNLSGLPQTINNPFTLAQPQAFVAAAGPLTLGGALTNGGHHLSVFGNVTLNGVVSGAGGIAKFGAGTLALGAVNTYAGPTTNAAGTISLNATATFGDGSGSLVFSGGELLALNTRSANPVANPWLLTGSTTIAGNGNLTNSTRILPFSASSIATPAGSLLIRQAGTNPFAANNVFRVRFTGGGFSFTRPITIGFIGDLPNYLSQLESYNDLAAGDQTFTGLLAGPGQLRRDAASAATAGRTILSGNNSYTGGTIVAAGTLLVNNAFGSGTGSGFVAMSNSATVGGTGRIAGPVSGRGTVAPGLGVGAFTLEGGLDLSAGGVLEWELAAPTTQGPGGNFDQLLITGGDLRLGATAKLKLSFLTAGATPNAGDPFWFVSHEWPLVALTGTATNSPGAAFGTIENAVFATGYFTNYALPTGAIQLAYRAIPGAAPDVETVLLSPASEIIVGHQAETNRTYWLQSSAELSPSAWQNVATNVAGQSVSWFTNVVTIAPRQFFRVVVVP